MHVTEIQNQLDEQRLEEQVKAMYTDVAQNPHGEYHFEMGRDLALHLGYSREELDAIPEQAIESFAGVGYYFGNANINPGESVVDLGSGSGMDLFIAANYTGKTGTVIGIDMTEMQIQKSRSLAQLHGFNVNIINSYIEQTGLASSTIDHVISNGVINLSPDKEVVFEEAYRILRSGGRLSLSDIVTETQLPENITCNSSLWAACIGGAMQENKYVELISSVGFDVEIVENNNYRFISKSAMGATKTYGVKSISVHAIKP